MSDPLRLKWGCCNHQEGTISKLLIHPGEHLADELEALGMSANELAKELGVPTNRLTQIIAGKRGITGDTALRLGKWFGTGPDIWMNLQKNYELQLAAQQMGDALEKIPEHRIKANIGNEVRASWSEHSRRVRAAASPKPPPHPPAVSCLCVSRTSALPEYLRQSTAAQVQQTGQNQQSWGV